MSIEWTTVIPILASFVTGGGVTALVTMRATKKAKELDNTSHLIQEYRDLLEKYKSEMEQAKAEAEEARREAHEMAMQYQDKHDMLSNEMSELKRQLTIVQNQLAHSNIMYLNANALRCENVNCSKRKPILDREYCVKMMGMDEQLFTEPDPFEKKKRTKKVKESDE